jgi:hypothetical protein
MNKSRTLTIQSLCDRNYNTPIFGELEESNHDSGLMLLETPSLVYMCSH